jgi:hypothetical protein
MCGGDYEKVFMSSDKLANLLLEVMVAPHDVQARCFGFSSIKQDKNELARDFYQRLERERWQLNALRAYVSAHSLEYSSSTRSPLIY